ncbi:tRNA dihydrouridine synthase DusB [Thermotoga sp. SG1]|uniref:tRNA dihydrouridine synthase DusB n=1 Tax=Thermotoga sp. SG1 TaxID=126739 RepID=UPI000C75DE73|nr:tRNA dihydrouridine synthase DusB [Thermotoga sp. SG1]PLV57624.1 hydrolase [Thermotoga sp. SG1]
MVKVGLAPMAGYTDRAFRTVCFKWGADFAFSEMVSAKGFFMDSGKTRELLPSPKEKNVAVQIFGNDPEELSRAARILSDKYPWIDLNAGCPVRKVVKKGAGGGLLKDLDFFRLVVREVRKHVKGKFTVKTRLGWDENQILKIYQILVDEGVDEVFIHARTVVQAFTGKADWKSLSVLDKKVPTFVSGDIFSPEDAKRALEESGCHGVLVARGAIGRPWLFKQIKEFLEHGRYSEPSVDDILRSFEMHLNLLVEDKGEEKAVKEMRKFMVGYTRNLKGSRRFRDEIMKIKNLQTLKEMFYNFLKEV